jgi:DNA/RNA endonuclease YhcR with UshA esterase domain
MKRTSVALLTVALLALPLAGSVSAHHSIQAQFDINKTVSITGTVAKVEWINPHSYLTLNVKDATGKVQKWAFEMAAAGQLRGTGLSRADRGGLKLGDEVTVTALASRDGSNTALAQEVKMADGRVFKLSAENPAQ